MQHAPRLTAETGLHFFREMARIRAFEERVRQLSRAGLVPGLVHLYSGQEAVAVGVAAALRAADYIASHHRGHGHCLARGADPVRLMAEILGRQSGYGLGRGGSLHVIDADNAQPRHQRHRRRRHAARDRRGAQRQDAGARIGSRSRFFGDGALNQGTVLECLNMASIWSLPVVFVCENNRYGEFTRIDDVTAGTLAGRAEAFAIPVAAVDGMDVLAVHAAARDAVARARSRRGPSLPAVRHLAVLRPPRRRRPGVQGRRRGPRLARQGPDRDARPPAGGGWLGRR